MINEVILKKVLSIPSYYGKEQLVRKYIVDFCVNNDLEHYEDHMGNIYVTKGELGEGEFYPCVVAHTDTVHTDQAELIVKEMDLTIVSTLLNDKTVLTAINPITNGETGIGGDDKCGVYLCLEMLLTKKQLKAAFFVQEEIGMIGSKEADPKFFENVGYAIQFDAPTNNWFSVSCNGVKLWNEEFGSAVTPLLTESNVTNFSYDPFTDVVQLKKKFDFCCSVLFSGYYRQHSVKEYVVVEDVNKSFITGSKMIETLGLKKYLMINK